MSNNHFIVFDPNTPPSILKILNPWIRQSTLSIPVEGQPKISGGYVSFSPMSEDGDPFDGELTVDSRYIVMHGCSPNNTLGFQCKEED